MSARDRRMALGPGREFDRIRAILARLGPQAAGSGDDCAVIPDAAGSLVVSVDLSVEGVHFRREWLTLEEIGWRAAAGALSDLAAEGAAAIGLLASVAAPRESPEAELLELMAGVGAAAVAAGGVVLGGDLTAGPQWIIDVTVLGRAARPVTRSGACPGDGLWVSGALGGARAALHAWQRGASPEASARRAFAHPVPRIDLGQRLAALGATAMIDLSDGLGGDAAHLAAASGCLVEIDLTRVPVATGIAAEVERAGISAVEFAARGGEDYELLCAMPPDFGDDAAARLADECRVPLTRVGSVGQGSGVRFQREGRTVPLMGFDHFA